MYSGDTKPKHSALVYSMSHLLRGTAGQNGVLPQADSGIPERGAGLQALLQYGFTAFGEWVSAAEFVGQLCALLVVVLAGRRTMGTWPVQVLATVLLFAVYT